MKKYAVFIDPPKDVHEHILQLKGFVESRLRGQPYCAHPPHSTLIVTWLTDLPLAQEALLETLKHEKAFAFSICGTICFYHDELAGGGHTFALKVNKTEHLSGIQQRISDALVPFIDHGKIPPLNASLDKPPFRESYHKYGFAFVGDHWLPHFTVASVRVSEAEPILNDLNHLSRNFEATISHISLVAVDGDFHDTICTLPLYR